MDNNQLEDFNLYCMKQLTEIKNISYYEEPKEEENAEEKEKNTANIEDKKEAKTLKLKESTSKRLSSLPKRYQTYTLDYKKQVIEEVNIYIIIINYILIG